MKDVHKEKISSLLDNELTSSETRELLREIETNQGLCEKFDRYALIRGALNEDVVVHQEAFLESVKAALVTEPTVLAPSNKKSINKTYVAAALAASFAFLAALVFDMGLSTYSSLEPYSVVSVEAEQKERLALDERLDEEVIENENILRPQLVTFER